MPSAEAPRPPTEWPELEVFRILGLHGDFERHRVEHRKVHLALGGHQPGLVLRRQEPVETADQAPAHIFIAAQLGEGKGAVPGAGLGLNDGVVAQVRAGGEALGHAFAYLYRRGSGRPVREPLGWPGSWAKVAVMIAHTRSTPGNVITPGNGITPGNVIWTSYQRSVFQSKDEHETRLRFYILHWTILRAF